MLYNLFTRTTIAALILALLVGCAPTGRTAQTAEPGDLTEEPAATDEPTTQPVTGGEGELIQANKPRNTNPSAPESDIASVVAGNTAFAFDLYHQTAGENQGNMLFSPYSITLAFAMVHAGARGETEAQIAQVLHYDLPQDQLHPAFNALDLQLVGTPEEQAAQLEEQATSDEPSGDLILRIANALWGQSGAEFSQPFLETISENYGAGLRTLDFQTAPDPSREIINQWVEEATEDRIQDLIPQDAITPETRMVLTNAIYFYGGWTFPFFPENTQDQPFTLIDGAQVTVPMMQQGGLDLPYASGDGWQAVAMPYSTSADAAMLIIVPDSGRFAEVEAALTADQFELIRTSMLSSSVNLAMPRFEFESEFALKDTLAALGMTAPFDSSTADFSGLTEAFDLFISAVIHKANITVDEEGTEAAAATAIMMGVTSIEEPETPKDVRLDRPFIFAIVDQQTGTVLFLGRVMNPGE